MPREHRVELGSYVIYGVRHFWWECSDGRHGTVDRQEIVRQAARAHFQPGDTVKWIEGTHTD